MSYRYYFFDDQQVGAEDLNKLVNLFVSDGVADIFENGTPYNISKLGEVVYSNASEGILPEDADTLKVSCDSGQVHINPGVAFFKDGTVIEIETAEQLPAPEDTAFYVYLESNALKNMAYPAVSEELPDSNVIPLAHVSETGAITDLRRFARGKTPSFYASDAGLSIDKTMSIDVSSDYLDNGKRITLVPKGNSYRYLILIASPGSSSDIEFWSGVLLFDKETQKCYNFSRQRSGNYTDDYTSVSIGTDFKVASFFFSTYNYVLDGNLYFEDGKTELEISKGNNTVKDSIFRKMIFPFELKVITC